MTQWFLTSGFPAKIGVTYNFTIAHHGVTLIEMKTKMQIFSFKKTCFMASAMSDLMCSDFNVLKWIFQDVSILPDHFSGHAHQLYLANKILTGDGDSSLIF